MHCLKLSDPRYFNKTCKIVLLYSYGHVGMLPQFHETSTKHFDVMICEICFKYMYNHPGKQ